MDTCVTHLSVTCMLMPVRSERWRGASTRAGAQATPCRHLGKHCSLAAGFSMAATPLVALILCDCWASMPYLLLVSRSSVLCSIFSCACRCASVALARSVSRRIRSCACMHVCSHMRPSICVCSSGSTCTQVCTCACTFATRPPSCIRCKTLLGASASSLQAPETDLCVEPV